MNDFKIRFNKAELHTKLTITLVMTSFGSNKTKITVTNNA